MKCWKVDLEPYYKRIIPRRWTPLWPISWRSPTDSRQDKRFVTRVNDMYGPFALAHSFRDVEEDMDGHELASDLKTDALMRHEERGEELGSTELLRG